MTYIDGLDFCILMTGLSVIYKSVSQQLDDTHQKYKLHVLFHLI